MADAVPLILMGIALVAIMIARALLMAARDHVRHMHPAWFEELGRSQGPRLGNADERARRRLMRPLVTGRFPPPADSDPTLRRVSEHLRFALTAAGLSVAGLTLIVVLRSQAG